MVKLVYRIHNFIWEMLILANSEKNRVYGILQLETLFKEIDSILIQSKKNMECLKRKF